MTIAEAISTYLQTATATTALCSGRVYWPFAKAQPTTPYVCVRLASARRLGVDLQGAREPREYTVEVIAFADSQSAAVGVATAIKTDLDNHTGITPPTTGVNLRRCYCADESDVINESLLEAGVFAVQQVYSVIA